MYTNNVFLPTDVYYLLQIKGGSFLITFLPKLFSLIDYITFLTRIIDLYDKLELLISILKNINL